MQAEQDRLDFQHAGTMIVLEGKLAWAPVDSPNTALDIACGTGIWCNDFAEAYPDCLVVGSDLTLIQPAVRFPNQIFVQEDSEELWVHNHPFDYIHLRFVYTCFDDPRKVIRSAFQNLNPGGWIEFQDASPVLQSAKGPAYIEGNPLKRYLELLVEGAAHQGRNILVAQHYKCWVEEAGCKSKLS
jgi:ubiquinone/menaquinone biosynthesis C-methylase UbiE